MNKMELIHNLFGRAPGASTVMGLLRYPFTGEKLCFVWILRGMSENFCVEIARMHLKPSLFAGGL